MLFTHLWNAVLAAGQTPNANAIMECARRHGHSFETGKAKAFFRDLRDPGRPDATRGDPQIVLKRPAATRDDPQRPALLVESEPFAPARGPALDITISSGKAIGDYGANAPSSPEEDSGTDVPPSSSLRLSPQRRGGASSRAQTALPLDLGRKGRAREILSVIWPRIEGVMRGKRSRSGWASANMRAAEELAELERSDADIIAAHESASRKLGEPVWMLARIVRELADLQPADRELNESERLPNLDAMSPAELEELMRPYRRG